MDPGLNHLATNSSRPTSLFNKLRQKNGDGDKSALALRPRFLRGLTCL